MAVVAYRRLRRSGTGTAFLSTTRAAAVALAASLGVCTAGSAISPQTEPVAKVAVVESTTTTEKVVRRAPAKQVRRVTTTTEAELETTTTLERIAAAERVAAVTTTTAAAAKKAPAPTAPPPTAPRATAPPATAPPATAPPATAPPATAPPATAPPQPSGGNCHPSYSPCIPPTGGDVDCAGGSGDGPRYVQGPVQVSGNDEYRLDNDGNGVGCES